MIALELSGAHINRAIKITYRFKSWKPEAPTKYLTGTLESVRHRNETIVVDIGWATNTRIPFDAEIEFLDE